jgi:CHASE3 domain sensor protein
LHAKKTRDRKKFFLDIGDKIIAEMLNESELLRSYLLSQEIISLEEYNKSKNRDIESTQIVVNVSIFKFFYVFIYIKF